MSLSLQHPGAVLLAALSLATAAQAQPLVQYRLVKDVNTAPSGIGSGPTDFVASGGKLYFSAFTPGLGRELYVSDGVSQAALVADLAPNGASSFPSLLGSIGSTLIVNADPGNISTGSYHLNRQVVAVPAGGAPVVLTQFASTPGISYGGPVARLTEFGGRVVFRHQNQLWSTDGTPAGTQRFFDSGTEVGVQPAEVCTLDDRIVFQRNTGGNMQLWTSNGLAGGTGKIAEFSGLWGNATIVRDGASCYFLAGRTGGPGWALVQSNGTVGGSGVPQGSTTSNVTAIAAAGGVVFRLEQDPSTLRVYRGDQAEPIFSAAGSSSQTFLGVVAGRLVFVGPDDGEGYASVYASDGTAAGTHAIQRDGAPLRLRYQQFVNLGNALLAWREFSQVRIDPIAGTASEYTAPFQGGYFGYGSVVFGGAVHFSFGLDEGYEPWRADGSAAGTRKLADIAHTNGNGITTAAAVAHDGKLVFRGTDGRLWRSNGSEAGTQRLESLPAPGDSLMALLPSGDGFLVATNRNAPDQFQSVYRGDMDFSDVHLAWTTQPGFNFRYLASAGSVLFGCNNSEQQFCAYRDGDLAPSVVVTQPGWVRFIGSVGNIVLFYNHGDVWRSDGTAPGTFKLANGPYVNMESATIQAHGKLWFEGCDDDFGGCDLLVSDGTQAGTRVVTATNERIVQFAKFADGVAFAKKRFDSELWRSDGTAAGTVLVAPLHMIASGVGAVGDRIHVMGYPDGIMPSVYVVSDGTATGTHTVAWVPGVDRGFGDPVALDADTAVFVCDSDVIGTELCAVDRLGQQMIVVADFYQGPQSALPILVAQTGGATYFSLDDGRRGRELWRFAGDSIFADGFR